MTDGGERGDATGLFCRWTLGLFCILAAVAFTFLPKE
jgi:hypothetical protein